MPSNSIDNCARVSETVPPVACGHTKRPRSSRFANKHKPSPSNQRTLMRSPRRPRNTNTCPENGLCSSFVCTCALRPVKRRRKSVTPPRSRFAFSLAMPSCPQTLQHHPHQGGIGVALDPHLCLPQFDVNRAGLWLGKARDTFFDYDRRRLALAHPHRQQLDPRLLLPKSSCQVESPPTKYLISVHTMRPRYPRHRCAWRQCLFHDPPLLRNASSLSLSCSRALFVSGSDSCLLRSVHLRSKWTPIPWVHFARMALLYKDVETVTTERLPPSVCSSETNCWCRGITLRKVRDGHVTATYERA